MQLLTNKTSGCISFRPRVSTDETYLNIINGDGCYSFVGRVMAGPQELSLQNNTDSTCLNSGTVVHELLHAAGILHEQSRQDRDNYVTINYQNMAADSFPQFDKEVGNYYNTSYDYYSIMHYAAYDFSINGQPTIVSKDPSVPLTDPADRPDDLIMTNSDILGVERFYQCPETVSSGLTTTTSTTTTSTRTTSTTKTSTTTTLTTTTSTTTTSSGSTALLKSKLQLLIILLLHQVGSIIF